MSKTKTIGFIGSGNMGEALISGLIQERIFAADNIMCSDTRDQRLNDMQTAYGIRTSKDNGDLITRSDIVVFAVKPQILADVIGAGAEAVNDKKLFISIAAGVPLKAMEQWLPEKTRLIRAMPNMCVTVKQGITALAAGSFVTAEDMASAQSIFNAVGRSLVLKEESLMDAVTGLSGSGPAYVFVILEALADGGVQMGLPREDALTLAAQTLLGAAAVYLEKGIHPGQLKDMVTSPAGTTIAGLGALEKRGVRYALREAVEMATRRSQELGK